MSAAVLTERETGALFQISGWPDSFEKTAGALMRNLGFAGLGDFRRAQPGGEMDGEGGVGGSGRNVSFRLAPERILVRLADGEVFHAAAEGLDLSLSPVLELTGSRRIFRIANAEVLSRLAAVDFSDAEFPPGSFAQAECLGTGMLFHRAGESAFDVYVPRSWGESFCDFAGTVGAGLNS